MPVSAEANTTGSLLAFLQLYPHLAGRESHWRGTDTVIVLHEGFKYIFPLVRQT